jgi:hypothetical protein
MMYEIEMMYEIYTYTMALLHTDHRPSTMALLHTDQDAAARLWHACTQWRGCGWHRPQAALDVVRPR